jgi:LPXTG-motif cell wall-anchored protein
MVIAIFAILTKAVFASSAPSSITIPTVNNNTVEANNTTSNEAAAAPVPLNTTPVNTLNSNVAKDNVTNTTEYVPQTGENDTYIIAGIGIVAVAIGLFSFVNVKRYER